MKKQKGKRGIPKATWLFLVVGVLEVGSHLSAQDVLQSWTLDVFYSPYESIPDLDADGFREAEIDQCIRLEIRMQHNIAKATLAAVIDIGNAGYRPGYVAVLRHDQQAAYLFGYEQTPIGQEGHRPGFFERGDRCCSEIATAIGHRIRGARGQQQAGGDEVSVTH